MAVSIKHAFQSAKGDGGDTSVVRPSNWNAEHDLTLAQDKILGRSSSGTGQVEEITCTPVARSILDDTTIAAVLATLGLTNPLPTANIADQAVTYPKIVAPSATSRLLGSNSYAAVNITGAANNGSGLVRLTVSSTTNFTTGQKKIVQGVTGTTEANGRWTITVVDGTHIDLQGSTFANTYVSGGTIGGGVDEIQLGSGLELTGDTLRAAPPVSASAVGLIITNNSGTPNSVIDITADQVTMLNSGGTLSAFKASVSVSINTSSTGANGLDADARASGSTYHLFIIYNPTTATVAGLASLSATAPTLPSGYTFFMRAGAMLTDGSGNFYRTKQRGNRTQYNGSTGARQVTTSGAASVTALSLTGFVPATAVGARVSAYSSSVMANGQVLGLASVSPSTTAQYEAFFQNNLGGSISSATQAMTIHIDAVFDAAQEVYYLANVGAIDVRCHGWTDKVNAS